MCECNRIKFCAILLPVVIPPPSDHLKSVEPVKGNGRIVYPNFKKQTFRAARFGGPLEVIEQAACHSFAAILWMHCQQQQFFFARCGAGEQEACGTFAGG